MSSQIQEIEEEFHVSKYIIFYKFFLGVIELTLGLSIIFFGKKALVFYNAFKTQELLEDPHDLLVNVSEKVIPYLLQHRGYVVAFLIVLGLIKISGAIGLIYKKTWGLDLLLGLTIILLPFQFYSLVTKPSLLNLFYFLFGIFIALWLVNFRPRQYAQRFAKRFKK